MSQTPSEEQQWQQPVWDNPAADAVSDPPRAEQALQPVTGPVLVGSRPSAPPSVLESTLTVVVSVVWPLAIVLAIFGIGGWWWNIGIAVVLSSLIGAINGELAKRRKAE